MTKQNKKPKARKINTKSSSKFNNRTAVFVGAGALTIGAVGGTLGYFLTRSNHQSNNLLQVPGQSIESINFTKNMDDLQKLVNTVLGTQNEFDFELFNEDNDNYYISWTNKNIGQMLTDESDNLLKASELFYVEIPKTTSNSFFINEINFKTSNENIKMKWETGEENSIVVSSSNSGNNIDLSKKYSSLVDSFSSISTLKQVQDLVASIIKEQESFVSDIRPEGKQVTELNNEMFELSDKILNTIDVQNFSFKDIYETNEKYIFVLNKTIDASNQLEDVNIDTNRIIVEVKKAKMQSFISRIIYKTIEGQKIEEIKVEIKDGTPSYFSNESSVSSPNAMMQHLSKNINVNVVQEMIDIHYTINELTFDTLVNEYSNDKTVSEAILFNLFNKFAGDLSNDSSSKKAIIGLHKMMYANSSHFDFSTSHDADNSSETNKYVFHAKKKDGIDLPPGISNILSEDLELSIDLSKNTNEMIVVKETSGTIPQSYRDLILINLFEFVEYLDKFKSSYVTIEPTRKINEVGSLNSPTIKGLFERDFTDLPNFETTYFLYDVDYNNKTIIVNVVISEKANMLNKVSKIIEITGFANSSRDDAIASIPNLNETSNLISNHLAELRKINQLENTYTNVKFSSDVNGKNMNFVFNYSYTNGTIAWEMESVIIENVTFTKDVLEVEVLKGTISNFKNFIEYTNEQISIFKNAIPQEIKTFEELKKASEALIGVTNTELDKILQDLNFDSNLFEVIIDKISNKVNDTEGSADIVISFKSRFDKAVHDGLTIKVVGFARVQDTDKVIVESVTQEDIKNALLKHFSINSNNSPSDVLNLITIREITLFNGVIAHFDLTANDVDGSISVSITKLTHNGYEKTTDLSSFDYTVNDFLTQEQVDQQKLILAINQFDKTNITGLPASDASKKPSEIESPSALNIPDIDGVSFIITVNTWTQNDDLGIINWALSIVGDINNTRSKPFIIHGSLSGFLANDPTANRIVQADFESEFYSQFVTPDYLSKLPVGTTSDQILELYEQIDATYQLSADTTKGELTYTVKKVKYKNDPTELTVNWTGTITGFLTTNDQNDENIKKNLKYTDFDSIVDSSKMASEISQTDIFNIINQKFNFVSSEQVSIFDNNWEGSLRVQVALLDNTYFSVKVYGFKNGFSISDDLLDQIDLANTIFGDESKLPSEWATELNMNNFVNNINKLYRDLLVKVNQVNFTSNNDTGELDIIITKYDLTKVSFNIKGFLTTEFKEVVDKIIDHYVVTQDDNPELLNTNDTFDFSKASLSLFGMTAQTGYDYTFRLKEKYDNIAVFEIVIENQTTNARVTKLFKLELFTDVDYFILHLTDEAINDSIYRYVYSAEIITSFQNMFIYRWYDKWYFTNLWNYINSNYANKSFGNKLLTVNDLNQIIKGRAGNNATNGNIYWDFDETNFLTGDFTFNFSTNKISKSFNVTALDSPGIAYLSGNSILENSFYESTLISQEERQNILASQFDVGRKISWKQNSIDSIRPEIEIVFEILETNNLSKSIELKILSYKRKFISNGNVQMDIFWNESEINTILENINQNKWVLDGFSTMESYISNNVVLENVFDVKTIIDSSVKASSISKPDDFTTVYNGVSINVRITKWDAYDDSGQIQYIFVLEHPTTGKSYRTLNGYISGFEADDADLIEVRAIINDIQTANYQTTIENMLTTDYMLTFTDVHSITSWDDLKIQGPSPITNQDFTVLFKIVSHNPYTGVVKISVTITTAASSYFAEFELNGFSKYMKTYSASIASSGNTWRTKTEWNKIWAKNPGVGNDALYVLSEGENILDPQNAYHPKLGVDLMGDWVDDKFDMMSFNARYRSATKDGHYPIPTAYNGSHFQTFYQHNPILSNIDMDSFTNSHEDAKISKWATEFARYANSIITKTYFDDKTDVNISSDIYKKTFSEILNNIKTKIEGQSNIDLKTNELWNSSAMQMQKYVSLLRGSFTFSWGDDDADLADSNNFMSEFWKYFVSDTGWENSEHVELARLIDMAKSITIVENNFDATAQTAMYTIKIVAPDDSNHEINFTIDGIWDISKQSLKFDEAFETTTITNKDFYTVEKYIDKLQTMNTGSTKNGNALEIDWSRWTNNDILGKQSTAGSKDLTGNVIYDFLENNFNLTFDYRVKPQMNQESVILLNELLMSKDSFISKFVFEPHDTISTAINISIQTNKSESYKIFTLDGFMNNVGQDYYDNFVTNALELNVLMDTDHYVFGKSNFIMDTNPYQDILIYTPKFIQVQANNDVEIEIDVKYFDSSVTTVTKTYTKIISNKEKTDEEWLHHFTYNLYESYIDELETRNKITFDWSVINDSTAGMPRKQKKIVQILMLYFASNSDKTISNSKIKDGGLENLFNKNNDGLDMINMNIFDEYIKSNINGSAGISFDSYSNWKFKEIDLAKEHIVVTGLAKYGSANKEVDLIIDLNLKNYTASSNAEKVTAQELLDSKEALFNAISLNITDEFKNFGDSFAWKKAPITSNLSSLLDSNWFTIDDSKSTKWLTAMLTSTELGDVFGESLVQIKLDTDYRTDGIYKTYTLSIGEHNIEFAWNSKTPNDYEKKLLTNTNSILIENNTILNENMVSTNMNIKNNNNINDKKTIDLENIYKIK